MNPSPYLTVLTAIITAAFFVGSAFLLMERQPPNDWGRTTGKIVDVRTWGYGEDRKDYPVVEYVVDGQAYRVTSEYDALFTFRGLPRAVYYNPRHPQIAVTRTMFEILGPPTVMVGFGFAALVVFMMRMRAYGLRPVRDLQPSTPSTPQEEPEAAPDDGA